MARKCESVRLIGECEHTATYKVIIEKDSPIVRHYCSCCLLANSNFIEVFELTGIKVTVTDISPERMN